MTLTQEIKLNYLIRQEMAKEKKLLFLCNPSNKSDADKQWDEIKYKYTIPKGTTLYIDGKPFAETVEKIVYSETPIPNLAWIDKSDFNILDAAQAMADIFKSNYDSMSNFEEQLSKIKQITMNKEIIEKIELYDRVEKVTELGGNPCVLFVSLKEIDKIAVECKKKKQFDFINSIQPKTISAKFNKYIGCIAVTEYGCNNKDIFIDNGYIVVSFFQYLKVNNLKDKWLDFSLE